MPDGSLFVPATVTDPSRPYPRITGTRDGSYWNLVMPYAFASGFFSPGGGEAAGILRYLSLHGSRILGVTRADAHIAYGRNVVGDGLGEVYVMNQSRFLADNDQPDQLTLSLYGMLAAGMTRDTFVAGEAVSLLPVGTAYYRTMYMPPNLGANSSFLETLKLLLVHERRGPRGAPRGLDLAFATPRGWLADGATIEVRRVHTSFGALSYSISRSGLRLAIDSRFRTHRNMRDCGCDCLRGHSSARCTSAPDGSPSTGARQRSSCRVRAGSTSWRRSDHVLLTPERAGREALDRELREIERRLDARARAARDARRRPGPAGSRGRRTRSRRGAPPAPRPRRSARCGRGSSRRAPPARADAELGERRQPPRRDGASSVSVCSRPPKSERGALAVEVERRSRSRS